MTASITGLAQAQNGTNVLNVTEETNISIQDRKVAALLLLQQITM